MFQAHLNNCRSAARLQTLGVVESAAVGVAAAEGLSVVGGDAVVAGQERQFAGRWMKKGCC